MKPREETIMATRRDFMRGASAAGLAVATGMAFCSCGMLAAARAQQPAGARLPVTVKGKRVKTIDLHSHCLFNEAIALMGEDARNVVQPTKGWGKQLIVMEKPIKANEAFAIDTE